jgi:hypothetical protein
VGMGMGVHPYPPVYMGDPVGLFFCRGYGYGVVIPGGYLPFAISRLVARRGRDRGNQIRCANRKARGSLASDRPWPTAAQRACDRITTYVRSRNNGCHRILNKNK